MPDVAAARAAHAARSRAAAPAWGGSIGKFHGHSAGKSAALWRRRQVPRRYGGGAKFKSYGHGKHYAHGGNGRPGKHGHFRRFGYYPLVWAPAPTTYGSGGCGWLYRQAMATGSDYWWDRYYQCTGSYY